MRVVSIAAILCLLASGAFATGEVSLIDQSGFEYLINTDVTFSTSSSASGAVSDALFTTVVGGVTTVSGDTLSTFLSEAFDGYNGISVAVDGGGAAVYNDNGAATFGDGGRTVIYAAQPFGDIDVHRKVFVPTDDTFCRWLNVFTNTDNVTHTVVMQTANNLASDLDTTIHSTSSGDATADTTDKWVVTYEAPALDFSTDPRLSHVLQGAGASVGLSDISFADGDENPTWEYTFEVAPGETVIIMTFVSGHPNLAAAEAKAASLAALEGAAVDFMSSTEKGQVINFDVPLPQPPRPGCFAGSVGNMSALSSMQFSAGNILVVLLVTAVLVGARRSLTQER